MENLLLFSGLSAVLAAIVKSNTEMPYLFHQPLTVFYCFHFSKYILMYFPSGWLSTDAIS